MSTFHICNIDLVKEYCGTCGEYFPLVLKPFQTIPFKDIWKCNQSNWEDAFRTWGAFQVWLALICVVVANLLIIISFGAEYIGNAIVSIIYQMVIGYAIAHLGWFAVTKKDGCCCLFVVCCTNAKVFILLWGLWCFLWGVFMVVNALQYLGLGGLAVVSAIFYIVYAVSLIYMGICLVKIWQNKGKEIAPPKVEVDAHVMGNAKV